MRIPKDIGTQFLDVVDGKQKQPSGEPVALPTQIRHEVVALQRILVASAKTIQTLSRL